MLWTWMRGSVDANPRAAYGGAVKGRLGAALDPGARRDHTMACQPSARVSLLAGLLPAPGGRSSRFAVKSQQTSASKSQQKSANVAVKKSANVRRAQSLWRACGRACGAHRACGKHFNPARALLQAMGQPGSLWMFGGTGLDGLGALGYLNDVWRLDTARAAHTRCARRAASTTAPAAPICCRTLLNATNSRVFVPVFAVGRLGSPNLSG